MHVPDLINGSFEFGAGVFNLLNCRALLRDKVLKGVAIAPTAFFTSWGAYNLYFYPHLGQWLSFAGGMSIFGVNILWIVLAIYYTRNPGGRPARDLLLTDAYWGPNS